MGGEPQFTTSPGDRLVINGHYQGEPERDGEILELLGEDGGPPFVVRWSDGHISEYFPSSDASVEHFVHSKDSRLLGRREAARSHRWRPGRT